MKHLDPRRDLMLRGLDDDGRLARLWDAGVFERMPRVVEHGMLGVEPEGDGWIVVMEDLGPALLPDDRPVSRAESRRMLAAAAQIHERFAGEDLPVGSAAGLYRFLSPAIAVAEAGSPNPLPGLIGRGWAALRRGGAAGHRGRDRDDPSRSGRLRRRVRRVAAHPRPRRLSGSLTSACTTTAWSSSTGAAAASSVPRPSTSPGTSSSAPPASRPPATRSSTTSSRSRAPATTSRALGLALIGALAQLGWNKALDVLENDDPLARARSAPTSTGGWPGSRRELDAWGSI